MFKYNKYLSFLAVIFVAVFLLGGNIIFAQEHPEHPKEHPTSSKNAVSKENLAKAITAFVAEDAALKGGYFTFYDAEEKETLALKLEKVHKARLAKIKNDLYFACADFKAVSGHTYDLDIFMKGSNYKDLKVTEITLHKKDGKARYKWQEKDGFWSRKK